MRRAPGAGFSNHCILGFILLAVLANSAYAQGQAVSVRHREGSARGFLVVRNQAGATLASGEFNQVSQGDRIKARLVFHFRDGSLDDETTVYSQKSIFRLISNRVVQRGRTFPKPCDINIDARSQLVTIRALSKDSDTVKTEHMDMPPDLSNGLLSNLIKNLQTNSPEVKVSYIAATSNPRMVKLAISLEKEGQFTIAGRLVKAAEWDVRAELGGLAGIAAPLIGKQPPDTHIWVAEGGVPTVVRVDTAMYMGGPVWSIQLASPVW